MTASTEFIGFLPAGTELFEYKIEQVLGHGGFGITYLVRDRHLDKRFALKEYLPAELALRASGTAVQVRSPEAQDAFVWGRAQFLHEARALGQFTHPNLVDVHRFFEANQTAYYIMDYVEGVTLGARLKRDGLMDEDELRDLLLPLLDGLEQVHRAGILHRDVKPDNIMLRPDGSPVLIDFGAARLNLGEMTHSIMSTLTAGYAPLEQYGSAAKQGPWTDIYALGAVTYRMLSGKRPLDAVSRVHEDPLVPAAMIGRGRFSEAFLRAIDWALAVRPEDRPRSVAEWRRALEEAALSQTVPTAAPPAPPDELTQRVEILGPGADGEPPSATVAVIRDQPSTPPTAPTAPTAQTLPTAPTASTSTPPPAGTLPATPRSRRSWLAGAAVTALLAAVVIAALQRGKSQPAPVPVAPPSQAVAEAPVPGAVDEPVDELPAPSTAVEEAPAQGVDPDVPTPAVENTTASPATTVPAPVTAPASPATKAARKPRPAPTAQAAKPPPAQPSRRAIAAMAALSSFRDCASCPLMVVLPIGRFEMGAPAGTVGNAWEQPAHRVNLARPRAIGRFEVTQAQWRACVAAKACPALAAAPAEQPVVQVSWNEIAKYTAWLSAASGRAYRLPTEAEWEYAVRGGTATARFWGEGRERQCMHANGADRAAGAVDTSLRIADCDDGHARLAPVGKFTANAFGLHDLAGNAWEWVQDCWRDSYAGAPADGSAVGGAGCKRRVIRGGSWRTKPESFRSATRGFSPPELRSDDLGFRVAVE